jgi:hypothetical protein
MTQDVRQAMAILEAQRSPVSARVVNRLLRATPPRFMGLSFRDLLPMLRIQPVLSETEQACRDLTQMAEACEAAVRDGATHAGRQKLIGASEDVWRQAMAALQRSSAQGTDVTALATAFERLGQARGALIMAHARR